MRKQLAPSRYVGTKSAVKFGGKWYDATDYAETKKESGKRAKDYRDSGYYVRVVRRSAWSILAGKPFWTYVIYTRKRK